ncbi:MAG: 23S rRNA (adenine(2503)-C(2))-methyltransferase RlmN [Treponemataceae bacterium]|nr:23S rRNA (adenine(2503)-C(2))-methyltransferase RlmN [Treponemataceae bacterium]
MAKIAIAGLLPDEIVSNFSIQEKFRGRQIFQWIAKGVESFSEMTNIPQELRNRLEAEALIRSSSISQILKDPDGTIKLQIKLIDDYCIETVLLTDEEDRKTACVSCQVGCAMACAFCQTGKLGFARNLSAAEIVEEFFHLEKIAGKLDNIVFMGMGEPMLNLPEIRKAIEILSSPAGRNLSTRRITLSTSGIIKGIYDLADNGPELRLAVSLTAADQELREKLMPVAKANRLEELSKAIGYYIEKTGKRCTLEAALLSGVNTRKEDALAMKAFAGGMPVHINLIPWNPVEGLDYKEPSPAECNAFIRELKKLSLNVTQRTRRGRKIGGACGQLGKISEG